MAAEQWPPRGSDQRRAARVEPEESPGALQEHLRDLDEDEHRAMQSFLANGGDPADLPGLGAFDEPDNEDEGEGVDEGQDTVAAMAEGYAAGRKQSNKRFQQRVDRFKMKVASAEFNMEDVQELLRPPLRLRPRARLREIREGRKISTS